MVTLVETGWLVLMLLGFVERLSGRLVIRGAEGETAPVPFFGVVSGGVNFDRWLLDERADEAERAEEPRDDDERDIEERDEAERDDEARWLELLLRERSAASAGAIRTRPSSVASVILVKRFMANLPCLAWV